MPPVFGPLSPSKARLWSCAVASGSACSPSHSAKNEASSPAMNSSITTSAPASPKPPPNIMSTAASASCSRHRHHDALAGGKAIGLDHDRRALRADIGLRRLRVGEMLVGRGRNVVGAAQRLGEALGAFQLPRRLGRPERLEAGGVEIVDDAGRDRRIRADHDEIDRVAPCRNRSPPAWSVISSATHSASRAMPALPGAHHSLVTSGEAAIFHARACSRPPEPSRRMFMNRASAGFDASSVARVSHAVQGA